MAFYQFWKMQGTNCEISIPFWRLKILHRIIISTEIKTNVVHVFQNGVIQNLVISANPASPPLSIAVLYQLLSQQYSIISACHTHSSVRTGVSDKLKHALGNNGIGQSRGNAQLALTLIWKDGKSTCYYCCFCTNIYIFNTDYKYGQ